LAGLASPGQVDTGDVVRLDEDHEDAAAGAAADHGAGSPPVDDEFSHWPAGAAGAASPLRGGHLRTEDVDQQAADGIAIHCVHQCPPGVPDRSVFTPLGQIAERREMGLITGQLLCISGSFRET